MQINMCAGRALPAANRGARYTHGAALTFETFTHMHFLQIQRTAETARHYTRNWHEPLEFCVDCSDKAISHRLHGKCIYLHWLRESLWFVLALKIDLLMNVWFNKSYWLLGVDGMFGRRRVSNVNDDQARCGRALCDLPQHWQRRGAYHAAAAPPRGKHTPRPTPPAPAARAPPRWCTCTQCIRFLWPLLHYVPSCVFSRPAPHKHFFMTGSRSSLTVS